MKMSLVKRETASDSVMRILVWAVMAMMGTRVWLRYVVNYYAIGRGEWHIAHVLFGGVAMLAGMVMMAAVHGEKVRRLSTTVFGIGLGWFVDEMGKFLTKDNDYFFQPAIMLIYIFFVVLFLVYRYLERTSPKDPKALLYRVINQMEEVAEGDLEKREKRKMMENLDRVIDRPNEPNRTFALELKKLIRRIPVIEDRPESVDKVFWKKLKSFSYNRIFKKRFVLQVLLVVAAGYVISGISDTRFLWNRFKYKTVPEQVMEANRIDSRAELNMFTMKSVFDVLTSGLFLMGIYWVFRKRKRRGIGYFQYGLLVHILLTSVFRFYFEQLSAVGGLAVSVVVYAGLSSLRKEVS